ncbi:hypothetical protein [Saccharopolyspora griseoalba]|uniref:Uncharacterized protein n=1 Tax=Saccharopolyspora griseoalba TaxID=1431848 RepID=A0ABW2LFR4_9PSEU
MPAELNAKLLDRLAAARGRRGVLLARRIIAALLLLLAAALALGFEPPGQPREPAREDPPSLVAAR